MTEIPADRYDAVYSANQFAGELLLYVTYMYSLVGLSVYAPLLLCIQIII